MNKSCTASDSSTAPSQLNKRSKKVRKAEQVNTIHREFEELFMNGGFGLQSQILNLKADLTTKVLSFDYKGDHYEIIPLKKSKKAKRLKTPTIGSPLTSKSATTSNYSKEASPIQRKITLPKRPKAIEPVELLMLLGSTEELSTDTLLEHRSNYEFSGPMAPELLKLNEENLIQFERQEVMIGNEYQAQIPPLLLKSNHPPPLRRYKVRSDPTKIGPEEVQALEGCLVKEFLLKTVNTEKLLLWLKELNYTISELFLAIVQDKEQAKRRLVVKKPKARIF